MQRKISPLVALIGLPNSGKSTLLNKLTGTRKAVTAKEAHTTRDLNWAETNWDGMDLRFVDTGGLVPDPEDKIQKEIQLKTWSAVAQADILVWVIDRKQDPDSISDYILGKVWKTGKPFMICINKVDNPNLDNDISDYARLGGFDFVNVSATNGYGLNELLDGLVKKSLELGFEMTQEPELDLPIEVKKKRVRTKIVHRDSDGKYFITRENSSHGPGLYQAVSEDGDESKALHSWKNKEKVNTIENVVFDFFGVIFSNLEVHFFQILLDRFPQLEGDKITSVQKLVAEYRAEKISLDEMMQSILETMNAQDNQISEQTLNEIWRESLMINDDLVDFMRDLKAKRYNLYYLTNISEQYFQERIGLDFFSLFDGGIASYQIGIEKPDPEIYITLLKKYKLVPENTWFIDDKEENVVAARNLGMWGLIYREGVDLDLYLGQIEYGELDRVPEPPKILLLGKPNVGKSSLFNALAHQDIQIVTDIPGTTLSVNDQILERQVSYTDENGNFVEEKKRYILLDSTGIRKPGQRTMGVETFATFRTIQTAYRADVIVLVMDGSQPVTHQDQVVAGIAREAKKGVVVVFNKADLVDKDQQKRIIRDFLHKFKFLKVDEFLWISAKTGFNLEMLWDTVDKALENRSRYIDPQELRRLFNYLMKKKPPAKLATKKRAVIYDLIYSHAKPPTFELLLKDKSTIHWSYVRFLENVIREQFDFQGTNIVVKLTEVERKKVLN